MFRGSEPVNVNIYYAVKGVMINAGQLVMIVSMILLIPSEPFHSPVFEFFWKKFRGGCKMCSSAWEGMTNASFP